MIARLIVSLLFVIFFFTNAYAFDVSERLNFNTQSIAKIVGKSGTFDSEKNTYFISIPRHDLNIVINGMKVTPAMGLVSKISFTSLEDDTELSADLILSQDQVNPVMSVVLSQGLAVTDLHDPFLWESPRVMLMHVSGVGNAMHLAKAMHKVLFEINTTKNGQGDFPLADFGETTTNLNVMTINSILKTQGNFKEGTYKINFARYAKPSSAVNNKEIIQNSWATFSGSNNEALLEGTVIVGQTELQSVLKVLRSAQIYILAIYQYQMGDDPGFMSVHYWGMGDARSLAYALRHTMVLAANHVSSGTRIVRKDEPIYPFLQNQHCEIQHNKWVKEFYPNGFKPQTSAVKSSNVMDLFRSGLLSLLTTSESIANNYLVNLAEKYVQHYMVKHSQVAAETSVLHTSSVAVDTAFALQVNKKDFHVVALLQNAKPMVVEKKLIATTVDPIFILRASKKDFHVVALLKNAKPIIVAPRAKVNSMFSLKEIKHTNNHSIQESNELIMRSFEVSAISYRQDRLMQMTAWPTQATVGMNDLSRNVSDKLHMTRYSHN